MRNLVLFPNMKKIKMIKKVIKKNKKIKVYHEPVVGILGYGEIGQAIAKFYKKPLLRDINIADANDPQAGTLNQFEYGMDILHICIPYSDKFMDIVGENIQTYKPKIVIIHSSVKPNTTWTLFRKYPIVVHSPVRGVHPNLYDGIKTFVKFVGSDDLELGKFVVRHYNDIGIKGEVLGNSYLTEMAKLIDTTYYGLCIAFHDYADKLCDKQGLNYEAVMTRYNETYNDGYAALDMQQVIRPVMYSPKGKIGGHCVIPNAELLKETYGENGILETILKLK